MIFLLDHIQQHQIQKFCVLDIVESRSKEMSGVSYITCVDIIAQVSLNWWLMFLFLDMPTLKVRIIIIIVPADPLKIILPKTKNKSSPPNC